MKGYIYKYLLTFILITFLFTCNRISEKEERYDLINVDLKSSKNVVIQPEKLDIENDYFMSFHSFLQANESGLYVTPNTAVNDTVLYMLSSNIDLANNNRLEGKIRKGNGPNELLNVSLSTKTIEGDTLIFYSSNSSSYIPIDHNGNLIKRINNPSNIYTTGSSLGYNKGYFLFPSFHGLFSKNSLLTLVNTSLDKELHFFEPRVPAGYEPSIRNEIFPISAIPDGFAFTFLGDRKIYITNFNGEILKVLKLGESDQIPEPYILQDPSKKTGAKPYITKMEFYKDYLIVLMDNQILIIDYLSDEISQILSIVINSEYEVAPVIDFTLGNNIIYLRIGREGLFTLNLNQNWFN